MTAPTTRPCRAATPRLEFFYFIGSTYTYLSVGRADALARRAGVDLVWRPFSVRTLMREQSNVPFAGKPAKSAYMWRDIERRAQRFGIPFAGVPPYPVDADELANRVATLAAGEGWCEAFTQAACRAWFVEHRDPGDRATLEEIVAGLGRPAGQVIEAADGDAVRGRYEATTEAARALGIFGSPTFASGREIFWGDDRLEDALDWCVTRSRES